MSGGAFDYKQYEIGQIADQIEEVIRDNDSAEKNEWGDDKGRHYSPETINRMMFAVTALRVAQIMAHRVDWLLSCDDGEEAFQKRFDEELEAYANEGSKLE